MIAYYAHSHGNGHCTYAELFAAQRPNRTVVFTDSDYIFQPAVKVVKLPDESVKNYNSEEAGVPDYLHYSPRYAPKILKRNILILQALKYYKVKLLVVDVSVEIASLARVSAVPYAYIKMQGERNDSAHLQAYQGAKFLIAYYPEALEPATTPAWVKAKTYYSGFISRTFPFKEVAKVQEQLKPYLLIFQGKGGQAISVNEIRSFKNQLPEYNVLIIGHSTQNILMDGVYQLGYVINPEVYIKDAAYIITACGSCSISELIHLQRKFLLYPEERPFHEQKMFAKNLQNCGLGIILEPNKLKYCIDKIDKLDRFSNPDYLGDISTLFQYIDNQDIKSNVSTY